LVLGLFNNALSTAVEWENGLRMTNWKTRGKRRFHYYHFGQHSLPSSTEIKNSWSYTSTPQYAFMTWCSVKAQGHIYLTFTLINSFSTGPSPGSRAEVLNLHAPYTPP